MALSLFWLPPELLIFGKRRDQELRRGSRSVRQTAVDKLRGILSIRGVYVNTVRYTRLPYVNDAHTYSVVGYGGYTNRCLRYVGQGSVRPCRNADKTRRNPADTSKAKYPFYLNRSFVYFIKLSCSSLKTTPYETASLSPLKISNTLKMTTRSLNVSPHRRSCLPSC